MASKIQESRTDTSLRRRDAKRIKSLKRGLDLMEKAVARFDGLTPELFLESQTSSNPEDRLLVYAAERAFEIIINDLIALGERGVDALKAFEDRGGKLRISLKDRKRNATADCFALKKCGILEGDLAEDLVDFIKLRNKFQHDYSSVRALEEYHYRIFDLPRTAYKFVKTYISWIEGGMLDYIDDNTNSATKIPKPPIDLPTLDPINPQLKRAFLPAQIVLRLGEIRDALEVLSFSLSQNPFEGSSNEEKALARLSAERAFAIIVTGFVELAREGLALSNPKLDASLIGRPIKPEIIMDYFKRSGAIAREDGKMLEKWRLMRNKIEHTYINTFWQGDLIEEKMREVLERSPSILHDYRDFLATQLELPASARPKLFPFDEIEPEATLRAKAPEISSSLSL